MNKRIIAASLATLLAGSLAACSAPAESAPPAAPAATQAEAATPAPSASSTQTTSSAAYKAVPTPTGLAVPTGSPGPGSVNATPSEDAIDFAVRKYFWAAVQEDHDAVEPYWSARFRELHIGKTLNPNTELFSTGCTLDSRIPTTREREAYLPGMVRPQAQSVAGIRFVAYPLWCPSTVPQFKQRAFVLVAAVNPQNKIEDLRYAQGSTAVVFGLPDTEVDL